MTHPLIPLRDIRFMLFDWLKADRLYGKAPFEEHSRETAEAVLNLAEQLAVDCFLPHYKQADQQEPQLGPDGVRALPAIGEALAQYAEAGLSAASFPAQYGGMDLPYHVHAAMFSLFAAANIATSAYTMLSSANARLITHFGNAAQIEQFASPQIEGRWFGTMCLSEPQAGSSLADVRTRAAFDGEDELGRRYRLVGNKMWISGGDHDLAENIVHLVLAKIPNADGSLTEGTKGLSLFIVPKVQPDGMRNDVVVAGLNHKMGYRGTVNCLLNFGEKTGALGWIVGEPGQGLRQMFSMMNEARISVGIGAAALGYRGYRHAAVYAGERLQGRPAGIRTGVQVPIIEHVDVRRMLLAQKAYVEGALALCLFCAQLIDEQGHIESSELLSLLTPVAKTWSSEYGLAANDLAIQVHGGYGYTRDFDVEQLYRDNRLNPIHEGTTGIQAADLLARKLLAEHPPGWSTLQKRIAQCLQAAAGDPRLAQHATQLQLVWDAIAAALTVLRDEPVERVLDNSVSFLRAFGHSVLAWIWLEQAVAAASTAAAGQDDEVFRAGKLQACRYFFDYEVPQIEAWLAPVIAGSRAAASAAPDIFLLT
ncbi:acyl-CoA dehydrogenase [Pseudomonas sp. H11T01]|uniref:acyl-CoA dehydrogenase n=1 Tax=Pseudomonas sp. H11T01 TaxID=3402749 RepID=UPI003AC0B8C9